MNESDKVELTDQGHQQLYLAITRNDGGGYFSKEVVPFAKLEQAIQGIKSNTPISSSLFKNAFVGQSANNAGFLAAILRAEKLIAPAANASHQHLIQSGWSNWKAQMLAGAAQAKPYEPELPKPRIPSKTATTTGKDQFHEQSQTSTPEPEANTASDTDAELDDAEMALLQHSTLSADISDREDEVEDPESIATVLDRQQSRKQRPEKRQHPTVGEQP